MTSTAKSLLVELFVEELPPKSLKKLGEAFAAAIAAGLRAQGLAGEQSAVTPFASPRRLAVHVSAVQARAADRQVSVKLMPVAVGLDADGQPTPALLKKLAAVGADASALPRLARRVDGKAEVLFLEGTAEGVSLAEGLQKALADALAALPIPKVMQYQLADGWTSVNFVRPAHGLVALHGADVVPVGVLGLEAGRQTRGHRFEAQMDPVALLDADHYARQLEEQGGVIPGFAARQGELVRQLQAAAAREGLEPIHDEALLDEVTALIERPNVLLARFEPEFLAVPQECLILTMKANQKYFPLLDADGRLTNKFLVVSNIRPEDASRVVGGNERVVRPRLADAKFFFDQDRRKTLASRVEGLAKVVYHAKLGSMGERVERVRRIAAQIGEALGGAALAAQAEQAARLAKADLLTDMVGEFPELQGIMGGYYARHDGLSDDIAFAIEDHYKPRFAGDALPRNAAGLALALADKLETLAGLFGIGQVPSGDKDPFALRRHALGLIRMLIERELPLEPAHLVSIAFAAFPPTHGQAQAELQYFLRERLVGYLREAGHAVQDVEAVIEARPPRWADFPKRLDAVRAFKALPEAEALAAANKRVGNILKKSEADVAPRTDAALFAEPAERALADALEAVAPRSARAFEAGDYTASLQALAALKAPVDAFFDGVMVNAEDARLRANRLGLLARLHEAMNRVADLSMLAA
ncbi:glycine--tRNA ligase subunit beta [Piscinibacter sp.]|uniref:glycine--tRNA ligase subunit beta n=1 Tax=Piscinibacter sp. TaxID=1903157 RepID=UPI0039E28871